MNKRNCLTNKYSVVMLSTNSFSVCSTFASYIDNAVYMHVGGLIYIAIYHKPACFPHDENSTTIQCIIMLLNFRNKVNNYCFSLTCINSQ